MCFTPAAGSNNSGPAAFNDHFRQIGAMQPSYEPGPRESLNVEDRRRETVGKAGKGQL